MAYYIHAFPDRRDVIVGQLTNIGTGWETDVYSFDVGYGPAGERTRDELILRLYPGDDAHAKSAHEFRSLGQLYKAGYPVPPSPFARP